MKKSHDQLGIALTTGADGFGIGYYSSLALALRGWYVFGVGLNKEVGERNFRKIQSLGCRAVFLQADLCQMENTLRVLETVHQNGPVQVLVNNAASAPTNDRDLHNTPPEIIEEALRRTALLPYRVTHSCLPDLVGSNNGRIVNISSINATRGEFGQGGYAAAKACVETWTKQWNTKYWRDGVRVNCIRCGPVPNRNPRYLHRLEQWPQLNLAIADKSPRGKVTTPAEVAEWVAFLASDASKAIGGEIITLDGGMSAAGGELRGGEFRKELCARYAALSHYRNAKHARNGYHKPYAANSGIPHRKLDVETR